MTEQQYIDKLKAMILLYKEIKKASVEFKDAGFAFPIAMTVSPYDEEDRIHLHGDRMPEIDFQKDDNDREHWDLYSADFAGVTFFYLKWRDEGESVAETHDSIRLTDWGG